ncbi:hypothetical protein BDV93DRAFT_456040 [Ceratobasidium sp. AG-I]|nr:hypothetical protein BDV93DRAFT_456040 [Ceratobasidium sp. AG-I]
MNIPDYHHYNQGEEIDRTIPEEVQYLPTENPALFDPPAACREASHIRLAYLTAVASQVLHNSTQAATEFHLNSTLAGYQLAGVLPIVPKPVKTLPAARRRLGLEVDAYIKQHPMCSECYFIYTHDDINSSASESCRQIDCSGVFWKTTVDYPDVRTPVRVAAYSSIVSSMRRLFMRPQFVTALRAGTEAHQRHTGNTSVLHDVCDGSAWMRGHFGIQRTQDMRGTVKDIPPLSVVPLGFGLHAGLNLDWFRITETYSVGGLYISILNLHRSVRNLPWNIILACTIPGPGEPSLEELNYVLAPVVEEFKILYAGITIRIYNSILPAKIDSYVDLVAMRLHMSNNDSIARAKISGTAGHSSARFFCICNTRHSDINTQKGYDISSFVMRDNWEAIQLSYDIRETVSQHERDEFASAHGIRWSALNELPGWLPFDSAPLDLMHNLYLGVIRHLWADVLLEGYYFSNSQAEALESFINNLSWPSNIGRVPKNVSLHTKVPKKADELRRLATILPVALWVAWRDVSDRIPLGAKKIPSGVSKPPTFKRCRKTLYGLIIQLCAGARLLGSWSVRLADVERAQGYLKWYCEGLIEMGVHLLPNHHWCMHYSQIFKRYGPAYAWWVYAYERYNGLLARVNLNNHIGQMETTLMRFWTQMHRIHELVSSEFLPANVSEDERSIFQQLSQTYSKRGTLNSGGNSAESLLNPLIFTYRQPKTCINLHSPAYDSIYHLLLAFVQTRWPNLNLKHDLQLSSGGMLFLSDRTTRRLPFITRAGIRYGSSTAQRNKRDQWALIEIESKVIPAQLVYHFEITVAYGNEIFNAVDLGTYTSSADLLGQLEVIDSNYLQSPLAFSAVCLNRGNHNIWLTISHERVRIITFQ